MTKVVVVVGATASGKSSLGIELAKRFNGEIISGDSVQVYKSLDIGSAKIDDDKGIKHHLIDILNPDENYSVYNFQQNARLKISEISSNGKVPIIVGGTGLYIKACLYDYEFTDNQEEINLFEGVDNETLYQRLQEIDFEASKKIHVNNRQRIVRALNICQASELTKSQIENLQQHQRIYDVLMIGIKKDRAILYQDIEKRVAQMFEQGLLDEVKSLLARGLNFNHQALKAIGYKEFEAYFNSEIDLDEVKRLIIRNTKRYAKRQETWFNNQEKVSWYFKIDENLFKEVENFLNE